MRTQRPAPHAEPPQLMHVRQLRDAATSDEDRFRLDVAYQHHATAARHAARLPRVQAEAREHRSRAITGPMAYRLLHQQYADYLDLVAATLARRVPLLQERGDSMLAAQGEEREGA